MHVIPVIDLKGGVVVRGIGGRRDEYRPVQSLIVKDARPHSVASGFARLGFRTVYVADLDAIAGHAPAWEIYDQIAAAGLGLWIDAGLSDVQRARRLATYRPAEGGEPLLVVGLESLPDMATVSRLAEVCGGGRLIFSLDLFDGRPLAPFSLQPTTTPVDLVVKAVAAGIGRVIILDLAGVGTGGGPRTLELCRQTRDRWPTMHIISGGGVRGWEDLAALANAGCDAALVASALHDGRIPAGELERWL